MIASNKTQDAHSILFVTGQLDIPAFQCWCLHRKTWPIAILNIINSGKIQTITFKITYYSHCKHLWLFELNSSVDNALAFEVIGIGFVLVWTSTLRRKYLEQKDPKYDETRVLNPTCSFRLTLLRKYLYLGGRILRST